MKKKIIVAGAGHGGLVCAAILAEKGYNVTVYEKSKIKDIGHDWTDTFMINCLDDAGIPRPPKNTYHTSIPLSYTNPAKTVKLRMQKTVDSQNSVMERKYLISYLIKYAAKKGVKFRFGTEIVCPITDSERVQGIVIKKRNKTVSVTADLVIDNAGMNSPVRTLLPARFGILNDFEADQKFTCYRAIYEKNSTQSPKDRYTVHFFHMRKPGISWIISDENSYDILIGRFGEKLTEDDIHAAVNDLKQHNPGMGSKVIRGGQITAIPIRRTIPLIVADGYAAVGNCAGMTIPIIGSGIANSIRAGKYLAEAILQDRKMEFTAETLWKYQYKYFKNIGNPLVTVDKIRSLCTILEADDVDYLLEKEILSEKELAFSVENSDGITALYILQKLAKALPKLHMLANATKTFARISTIKKVLDEMPEKYDAKNIKEWCQKYEEL